MDLEKQKLEIKGALVHFYRNASQEDYLQALENAIEEIQTIKNINYTSCSTQLKSLDVLNFEEWKQKFVVKTETNNVYEFRGDFVLGEDLEFAYNKDIELYNSLIV